MGGDGPRVVAVGGGHGLAMTIRAARSYAGDLTAVVATGDDGGSSGRLIESVDMPAPGDLRRCLSAMTDDATLAAGLEHRFDAGDLAGHPVGNLVLAGLVDAGHDLTEAASLLGRWLGIDTAQARVLPATVGPVTLVGSGPAGEVRGQVAIETSGPVDSLAFEPADPPVPDPVLDAIAAADQVVLGPGSFVTSVLAAAALPAVAKAVAATTAPVVLVVNLHHDPAADVGLLRAHGLDIDLAVVPAGIPTAGLTPEIEVVEATVAGPDGESHDATLLAPVLAGTLP